MTTKVTTPNIPKKELRKLLTRYNRGETKKTIEQELGVANARGKYITRQWYNRLGVDTRHNATTATVS